MFDPYFLKNNYNIINGFKTLKLKNRGVDFPYSGVVSFCGCQGSGKSLSAFRLMAQLKEKYPHLTFVSNTDLSGFTDFVYFESPETIADFPKDVKGIVLFLDEICNMPNLTSLDSKNMPRDWFALLNMQRKRELLIITTCPIFQRISKAFREQIDTVVLCKCYGTLQINRYCKANFDDLQKAESSADIVNSLVVDRRHIFFHSPEDYARYDTKTLIYDGKEKKL